MDSIYDMIIATRTNSPVEMVTGSEDSDLVEDLSALRTRRDAHFDKLMAMYQEERCHLRNRVDCLHLQLQSLRMKSVFCHDWF